MVVPFRESRGIQNKPPIGRKLGKHLGIGRGNDGLRRSPVDVSLEKIEVAVAIGFKYYRMTVCSPCMWVVGVIVQSEPANVADAWWSLIKVADEHAVLGRTDDYHGLLSVSRDGETEHVGGIANWQSCELAWFTLQGTGDHIGFSSHNS